MCSCCGEPSPQPLWIARQRVCHHHVMVCNGCREVTGRALAATGRGRETLHGRRPRPSKAWQSLCRRAVTAPELQLLEAAPELQL